MGSPRLTSLSCSILTLLPGASMGPKLWNDPPLHIRQAPSQVIKLVLKPIFIPWLLTQHETLFLFYCFNIVIIHYCFYIVFMFYVLFFVLLFHVQHIVSATAVFKGLYK